MKHLKQTALAAASLIAVAWAIPANGGSPVGAFYVPDDASLGNVTPTAGARYERFGFHAPGDGGHARYAGSLSNCAANGYANDNGGCKNVGSGSWILDRQAGGDSVKVWGSYGDNSHDDTSAIQAALNFGGKILFPPGKFRFSVITYDSTGTQVWGAGEGQTYFELTTGAGVNAINVTGSGGITSATAGNFASGLYDVTIDGTNAPSMNSYALACNNAAGFNFDRVGYQNLPGFLISNCNALGVGRTDGFDIAPGGIAMRLTGGSAKFYGPQYYQSDTPGGYPDDAQAWLEIDATTAITGLDAGVISDVKRCIYIAPSSGQTAEYIHVGGVQCDQMSVAGIEAYQPSGATIHGLYLANTWSSTAPIGVYLHADSGGSIDTVQLDQVQAKGGVDYNLEAVNVNNLSVNGGDWSGAGYNLSTACTVSGNTVTLTGSPTYEFNVSMMFAPTTDGTTQGNGQIVIGGTTYHLNNVLSGTQAQLTTSPGTIGSTTCAYTAAARTNLFISGTSSKVTIRGVKGGLSTDGNGQGTPLNGIVLDTTVDNPTIVNNDLSGPTTPLAMNKSGAYTSAFVENNRGVDDQSPNVTPSSGTLTLGPGPVAKINSNGSIGTIAGPLWPNRTVKLLSVAGANTFGTGGNILNGLTSSDPGPWTEATYFAGSGWALK